MRNLSSRKMLSPNGNLRHAETDKMKTLRPYLIWFAVAVLLTIGAIFGMQWVREHPEHFPGARFELAHPRGWATHGKLVALENRTEEHTSELQSLMRISYAVFCLNKKTVIIKNN